MSAYRNHLDHPQDIPLIDLDEDYAEPLLFTDDTWPSWPGPMHDPNFPPDQHAPQLMSAVGENQVFPNHCYTFSGESDLLSGSEFLTPFHGFPAVNHQSPENTINTFAFSPTTAITMQHNPGTQLAPTQLASFGFPMEYYTTAPPTMIGHHNIEIPSTLSSTTRGKFCKNRECMHTVNRVDGKARSPYCCNKCQTREQNLRQGRVRPNKQAIAMKNTVLILSQLNVPDLPGSILPFLEKVVDEDPDPEKLAISALDWLKYR
ncbi:hypothetical protein RCL1_003471 [Eukaryota sp. TZLM3-RCL]